MVWSHLDHQARRRQVYKDRERNKSERKTKEEMGRHHQRMCKNGVWRFPEGSGRKGGHKVCHLWCPDQQCYGTEVRKDEIIDQ